MTDKKSIICIMQKASANWQVKKKNWIAKLARKLNSMSQKGKFKCCLYKKMHKLIKDQENAN